MHSTVLVLLSLLVLPSVNTRFIDFLQNMNMAKQHMEDTSEEKATSEVPEGTAALPERHHRNQREAISPPFDEGALLLLSVMKREVDSEVDVQNLTTVSIRPAHDNGIWTFLDGTH